MHCQSNDQSIYTFALMNIHVNQLPAVQYNIPQLYIVINIILIIYTINRHCLCQMCFLILI
jgi:hypothetical protein